MTDSDKFAQADEAAANWQPKHVRDGTGLFPKAPTLDQIVATPPRPLSGPIHRDFPPPPPIDMEMPMSAGAAPSPPPPDVSGNDPGP